MSDVSRPPGPTLIAMNLYPSTLAAALLHVLVKCRPLQVSNDAAPSSPDALLPQQYASPSNDNPHVWPRPALIACSCGAPSTARGSTKLLAPPLSPCEFNPQ